MHRFYTSRGKNALKNLYFQKAILFIESEIELLKLRFVCKKHYPKDSSKFDNTKIYFIPKSKCLGIDSMGELASAFELSNQFIDESGKPVPYIHIANKLEEAFNFTFADAYKSKGRVFSRKPCNLTNALDFLKNLLIRERQNRDKRKNEKR